ncbi:myotrophin-like [Gigantopelta aegis]|uniref:myotrophin-like n=1 Tax=Gigantopelta aegis TaxID=1735272 RepID=UPI001B88A098|nr:myotrophin-like [Gigantopelta aegis]
MLCDNLCDKSDKRDLLKSIDGDEDIRKVYGFHAGDWLLDHGCCIDARNQAGQTALHVCVQCDELKNLKFLLNRGADMSCVDNEGNSVLHYAVERFQAEAVDTLLESGAVDSKNNDGITAFDLAFSKMNLYLDEDNMSKCCEIINLLSDH